MALEDLKKHMEGNDSFLQANPIANLTPLASLRVYRGFITEELAVVLKPETTTSTAVRSGILNKMHSNSLFKDRTSVVLKQFEGSFDKVPADDALYLIRGPYVSWLMDEMDDLNKTIRTMEVQEATGSGQTGTLKDAFSGLMVEKDPTGEKAEKGKIAKGIEAGTRYQQAKVDKTALKEEVKKFLGVTRFGYLSSLRGTVTDDAVQLLQQEKERIQREIRNMEELSHVDKLEGFSRTAAMLRLGTLKERWKKADEYIEQLRERREEKTRALGEYEKLSREAQDSFNKVDIQFREQNKKFIKGIDDLAKTIRSEEEVLRKKKGELDNLVAEIDALTQKIWEEEHKGALLKDKQEEVKKLLRTGGDVDAIKAIEKTTKRLNEEIKKLQSELANASVLQANLKKWNTQLNGLRERIPILSVDLALIDTRYSVLRECVDQVAREQRDLVSLRNELREELAWMKKLKTVDTGLTVYCSTTKVCFPLLLNIGKLAAGEACGPLGVALATSVTGLFTAQKLLSSGGLKDTLMSAGGGVVGLGLTGGTLARIHAYDTGSFNLNLTLGLSVGKSVGGAGIKGGIALIYSAGFTQEDDRRFRTVFTLSVEVYGEFAIPELVEAEIGAELVTETTGMTFQDVFHWAAWLAQKWANIAAMLRASKFFDVLDQWGMPNDMRKRQMMDMAKITMANDPQLFQIFQETMKYVNLPVIRMVTRDWLGGVSGGASVASAFGAGFSLARAQEPRYYMRVVTQDRPEAGGRRHEKELCKEGSQISQSGWLMAGVRVDFTISKVAQHAVVDNEGESYLLAATLQQIQKQTGFEKPGGDASGPIAEWVAKTLAPVVKITNAVPTDLFNAIQESSSLGCFNQISGSVGTDSLQFCFYRSMLARGESKVVLMYWRPVFSTTLEVSGEIETGVPGLNIDLSMGASLTRTYAEQLGTNTISYVQIVFNGLMNVTDFDKKPEDEPRPEYARGTTLWGQWAAQHNNSLYLMMKRIAEDKLNKEWITKEVLDLGGGDFVKWLKAQESKFKQQKLPLLGSYNVDKDALKRLRDFLYNVWKSKDYQERMKKGWEPVPLSGFRFAMNPILLAQEVGRSRTQAYKLDSALRSLGPRRGLKELYAEEAQARRLVRLKATQKDHWVEDDLVDRCSNCSVLFSMSVWKHHCRECGKIFCSRCLPFAVELPNRGYTTKEKVCADCYQKVTAAKEHEHQEHEHAHDPHQAQPHDPNAQPHVTSKEKDRYGSGDSAFGALRKGHLVLGEVAHQSGSGLLFVGQANHDKAKETVSTLKNKSEVSSFFGKGHVQPEVHKKPEDKLPDPTVDSFKEVDAGGGGDCLFRSVSLAVFGNEDHHLELRRRAVQHMEGFKGGVQSSLLMEKESGLARQDVLKLIHDHPADFVDKYLNQMKGSGMWGGAPELRALCRVLNRKIIVHAKVGPSYPVLVEVVEERDQRFLSSGASIHIVYLDQGHYRFLRPLDVHGPQPAALFHHLSYHGTSSKFRDSLRQGLKPMTSAWDPASGGELGPGFYTTKEYGAACLYGMGTAGAKGGGVDVWSVESLTLLSEMQGHGIQVGQQFQAISKELCDQYHYFYNAAEVDVTEIKFNEWTYPFLRLTLHKQMSIDEADEEAESAKKGQGKKK